MKRARKLSGEVQIVLDEYHRDDVTAITMMIIPVERIKRFEDQWRQLQRDIKYSLLKDYPAAKRSDYLMSGGLPEIHAVEIYKCCGYYRREDTLDYQSLNKDWLARAVAIIANSRVTILSKSWDKSQTDWNVDYLGLPSETFAKGIKYKKMRNKMDRLFKSNYVWLLNHMISYIEEYFLFNKLYGTLLCDDHDDGRGFSLMKTFDIARDHNDTKHNLPAPRFASSNDHPLLQAVDVASYIFGTLFHAQKKDIYPPDDILQWAVTLRPSLNEKRMPPIERDWWKSTARLFELLLAHSGGPSDYRKKIESTLPDFLKMILQQGEHTVLRLDNDGLHYGIEMYRPPSEDGDLSATILAFQDQQEKPNP